ncbi:hypothetical protein V6N13_036406 [Hibiscus sabdariffa]
MHYAAYRSRTIERGNRSVTIHCNPTPFRAAPWQLKWSPGSHSAGMRSCKFYCSHAAMPSQPFTIKFNTTKDVNAARFPNQPTCHYETHIP